MSYNFIVFVFVLECRIFLKKINVRGFFHAELNGDHKADEDDNEETAEINNQISSESCKFDKNELQPDTPTPTATAIEATELIKEKTIEIENNTSEVSEAISNEKEMDTDEDKPLARRRRSLIKVVQPTVSQNFHRINAIIS